MLQSEEERLATFSFNFPHPCHLNLQKMRVSEELKTKFEIALRIIDDAIIALRPLCGKKEGESPTAEQNGTLRFLADVVSRCPRYSRLKSSEELLKFLECRKEGVMWLLSSWGISTLEQRPADGTVTLPPLPEKEIETLWFLNFTAELSRALLAYRH